MPNTIRTIKFRRKRDGKTNYKKRLSLLKSRENRLAIRKTNTQIILQIIKYETDGDKPIVTVQSSQLKKLGWKYSFKNLPAAYLAGLLLAKKAKEKGIKKAILDMGLQSPKKGNKIYSALKGVIDGDINVPANEDIFPPEDRLKGEHVGKYLEQSKNITQDFEKIKTELTK
ncbi:50S ribosomal protein L18 [Candidatus Woesearchaeota archaeon]|nr:50S ribosomal protein L18 [Candidatus Woesearchaeota archaeon]MCF7901356.1 50S ribosomal protein L18 [Candidatus Woesearchaeota archaeon]MCF8013356.1 50S ribosomal protein L18 [Candidatus Woesearchaeota archaeon]